MALVILQIVGYQNSGKTTFVQKLLSQLKERNMKVVTIKHHGHGGKPKVASEKDSSTHISSGAFASIVEGEGRLLLQAEKESWTLEEQITIAQLMKPDLILIEGHKHAHYPKVVLIRSKEDLHLLQDLNNIQVVLYEQFDDQMEQYVSFQRDDEKAIDYLLSKLIVK